MTISVRQLTGAVVVSFCVGAFIAPVGTRAAQGGAQSVQASSAAAKPPTFMMVEFMKVPEGKEEDWLKLEREWKPMHALRVKDGSIQSWAAIAQSVPGDESNGPVYATVTTYRGWPDPTKMNFEELVKKAHPQGNVNALMQQTESARRMVRTEIWQVLEQTEPAVRETK
jgi:hypothetical protein